MNHRLIRHGRESVSAYHRVENYIDVPNCMCRTLVLVGLSTRMKRYYPLLRVRYRSWPPHRHLPRTISSVRWQKAQSLRLPQANLVQVFENKSAIS
jgi:hypothetical protein